MAYLLFCLFFTIQGTRKHENLFSRNLGHSRVKLDVELNQTSKDLNLRSQKKILNKFYIKNTGTSTKKENVNKSGVFNGLKCNMTEYLGLGNKMCSKILSEGNFSLMLNILGKNGHVKNKAENGQFSNNLSKTKGDTCDIDNLSKNCDLMKKSFMYGKDSVTDEEKLFPLAFAMKIHRSVNQAHRLLRYIYRPHNTYCIHIDKKSPIVIFNQFKHIESCFDNVIVIDDRINVVYSTIRQVEAELKCMAALSKANTSWKYYINLTGQEFMLRTNLEIVKVLRLMNGTNDIESYPVPPTEYHKFKQRTVMMNNFPFVTKQRKKPFKHNIKIHKGSAYGLFCRQFVNFVLTDYFVKEFLKWLRDAYAPEELIWATLQTLPGTPGGRKKVALDGDNTFISRAVKWKTDDTVTCHGKHVHWICIYGLGDVPWLLSNRNIVANKFYEDYEPMALDCLESKMYERLMNGGISDGFNIDTYRKLLHI